jgi:hypothetical protein
MICLFFNLINNFTIFQKLFYVFPGGFNTYMRAGKLFPGPHLYAGMAITGLWAASAALVPAMQKGNESARTAHIVLNSITILLFGWQVYIHHD